ncbi:MAG: DNA-binding protein, partial [Thermoplasmata archaeon]
KQDDEYLLHIHAVLGDENKKTIGGHFINGVINVTGEIVILKTKINAKRVFDKETGLKALELE